MSTWTNIPKRNIEIDGDEVNVLVGSDEKGNNYIVLSLADVTDLTKTNPDTSSRPSESPSLPSRPIAPQQLRRTIDIRIQRYGADAKDKLFSQRKKLREIALDDIMAAVASVVGAIELPEKLTLTMDERCEAHGMTAWEHDATDNECPEHQLVNKTIDLCQSTIQEFVKGLTHG